MPIKIIKRGGKALLPTGPVDGPKPELAKPAPVPPTPKEAIKAWTAKVPAPDAKPKPCEFCGHVYLMPCSDTQKDGCANFAYKSWQDTQVAERATT